MFQHGLRMEVRDQEGDVIALEEILAATDLSVLPFPATSKYLDRFPPQNEEGLSSLCQKPLEFVYKDVFDLVGLLDLDAYAHTVDRRFDEHTLVLVPRNRQWGQQNFRGGLGFYLWDVVSLCGLGCEVGETERSC